MVRIASLGTAQDSPFDGLPRQQSRGIQIGTCLMARSPRTEIVLPDRGLPSSSPDDTRPSPKSTAFQEQEAAALGGGPPHEEIPGTDPRGDAVRPCVRPHLVFSSSCPR